MNPDAVAKIKMIKRSMRCLAFGLLGLIPVIGLPFALAALWFSYQVRRAQRHFWNPARVYWRCGFICASFCTLLWGMVDTIIIYNVINALYS